MTVATVDTIVADVMFMTELDRLLPLHPLARVPRRTIQFDRDPQSGNNDEESAIDRNLSERICTVMEDLWHRRRLSVGAVVKPVLWQTNSPQTFRTHKCLLQSNEVLYQMDWEFQIEPQKSTKSTKDFC